MTPKVLGYHEIALVVTDLERSERFYHDVLGMRVLFRIPGKNVTVSVDGEAHTLMGLWLPGAHDTAAGQGGKIHFTMAINAADGDAWYNHLLAHGVKARKRIKVTGDVHVDFDDPDGHPLEFWGRAGELLAGMPDAVIPQESRRFFYFPDEKKH